MKIDLKKYCILLVLLSIYFIGYYVREISNGAAHGDLGGHIWKIIQDLEKNFDLTLVNYYSYAEGTFPFFHISQNLLNPFSTNVLGYTFSNTVFNLLVVVFFAICLKKKNIYSENVIFYVPLILLISPWFRSTSYWGTTENFALLFIIPGLYYFEKIINKNNIDCKKYNIYLIIYLTLATYARQQYFFLVIAHYLILFQKFRDIKFIINTSILYFILGTPAFYIFFFKWDILQNLKFATSNSDHISIANIPNNFLIISSIIFFYFLPIFVLNYKKIKQFISLRNLCAFLVIFLLIFLLFKNIEYPGLGGGMILKFDKFIIKSGPYALILTTSLLMTFFILIFEKKYIAYYLILLSLYLWFGLIDFIYQEWFDPFYLFLLFILIPKNLIEKLNLDGKNTLKVFYSFEFTILLIALLYYHVYLGIPLFYKF